MTAPLIAPLIPPHGRPSSREHGRPATARRLPVAAAPEVPAVPDDVVYGFGLMDESGRVADRTMTSALGYPWGQEELASAAAMPHGTFARVPAHHRHHARRYRRTRLGMHKRRSGTYKPEWGYRSVKPSAQPTLVRTQHLPPPAKTAR
jgi:hypothetical protein